MKDCWGRNEERDTNGAQPWSTFFLFCSEFHSKVTSTNPGISTEHMEKMWVGCGITQGTVKIRHGHQGHKAQDRWEGCCYLSVKGTMDGGQGSCYSCLEKELSCARTHTYARTHTDTYTCTHHHNQHQQPFLCLLMNPLEKHLLFEVCLLSSLGLTRKLIMISY